MPGALADVVVDSVSLCSAAVPGIVIVRVLVREGLVARALARRFVVLGVVGLVLATADVLASVPAGA